MRGRPPIEKPKGHTWAMRLDAEANRELRELAITEQRPVAALLTILVKEALKARRKHDDE